MAILTNLVPNKLHPVTGEELRPTLAPTVSGNQKWRDGTTNMTDALCGGLYNKDTEPTSPTNGKYFRWNFAGAYPVSRLTTVNQSNFQKLLNDFGTSPAVIFLDKTVNITSNLTIPSNVRIDWMPGAIFNISSGITLTVNSEVNEGDQQLFSNVGNVTGLRRSNARWFGAKGDGTTDDSSPIQKSINAVSATGGIARLPKGSYVTSLSIDIPSNVYLQGDGFTSELKGSTSTGYPLLKNADFANGNNNITISDLKVFGNRIARGLGEDAASHGIRIQAADDKSCDRLNIMRVWVTEMPCAGMMLFNVRQSHVSDNLVSDTMRDGISTWFNSERVSFSNNIMWDIRDDGYGLNSEVTGHEGTIIKHVTITGGSISHANDSHFGSAVRVAGAWDVTVTGVSASNIQGHGMLVEGSFVNNNPSKRVAVTGCTVFNTGFNTAAGGHGMAIANVQGCNLSSNVIDQYYLNGINLSTFATDCNVIGNTVYGGTNTAGVGIYVDGTDNNIKENYVKGTRSFGIRIGSVDNTVSTNTVKDCCISSPGNAYIIIAANINYVKISGNKMLRTNSSNGTYGVRVTTGSSTGCHITDNYARGFGAGNGISSSGTGVNVFRGNMDGTVESLYNLSEAIRSVATNTAFAATDKTILVDASGAARTVTLPTAASAFNSQGGKVYTLKKTDSSANAVTMQANGAELIDDANTKALTAQWQFIQVISDGTKWYVISS